MMQAFCNWLSNTWLSLRIQDVFWVIPTVQTVHILAIAVVMSSVTMVDLRLLGVAGRSQSLPDVAHRFLPWVWTAIVVLLCTGIILIIGEPGRELLSPVFWLKMSLLACVLLVTAANSGSAAGWPHGSRPFSRSYCGWVSWPPGVGSPTSSTVESISR